MADPRERPIVMAEIGAPHGVRGAVRLTVYAEDPLALPRYNPFEDAAGRRYKLTRVAAVGKAIVAEIEGVKDRDAATRLRGVRLTVPRKRLPQTDEDEFYYVDLVGLEARDLEGRRLGEVRGVADFGAGDVIEIAGERTLLLPFTRAVVPFVDLSGGTITVDPPRETTAGDAADGPADADRSEGAAEP